MSREAEATVLCRITEIPNSEAVERRITNFLDAGIVVRSSSSLVCRAAAKQAAVRMTVLTGISLDKAVVTTTIRLRLDRCSTNCNSTALRPFDDLRCDRRPTCCGLLR